MRPRKFWAKRRVACRPLTRRSRSLLRGKINRFRRVKYFEVLNFLGGFLRFFVLEIRDGFKMRLKGIFYFIPDKKNCEESNLFPGLSFVNSDPGVLRLLNFIPGMRGF